MTSFEKLLSELPSRYDTEVENLRLTIQRQEYVIDRHTQTIAELQAHLIKHGLLQNGELIER